MSSVFAQVWQAWERLEAVVVVAAAAGEARCAVIPTSDQNWYLMTRCQNLAGVAWVPTVHLEEDLCCHQGIHI